MKKKSSSRKIQRILIRCEIPIRKLPWFPEDVRRWKFIGSSIERSKLYWRMHSAKKVSFNWMSDFFARNEISDRKTHQTSKCIEHKKTEINIAMRRYVLHNLRLPPPRCNCTFRTTHKRHHKSIWSDVKAQHSVSRRKISITWKWKCSERLEAKKAKKENSWKNRGISSIRKHAPKMREIAPRPNWKNSVTEKYVEDILTLGVWKTRSSSFPLCPAS